MRANSTVKALACLLALAFLFSTTMTATNAETQIYPVQYAVCAGFDIPITPANCTAQLNASDDIRFRMNADVLHPARITNATWNISLNAEYTIDTIFALNEWQTNGELGKEWIQWQFCNRSNNSYRPTGCANNTVIAQNTDQTNTCNLTNIYQTLASLTSIQLEVRYIRDGAKKDFYADYFALNITYHDSKAPSVFDINPKTNSILNVTANIEISANITDIGADKATAEITYPNNTKNNLSLFKSGTTDKYNTSLTIPNNLGQYSIRFTANDTSGNTNNTEAAYFNTYDNIPPTVSIINPITADTYNLSFRINIITNITDNIAILNVFANITNPNNTNSLIQLYQYENQYNNTIILNQNGIYTIQIIANDTTGNMNNTETTYFTVPANITAENTNTTNTTLPDTTPPAVLNITPLAGTNFSLNSIVDIIVHAIDDTAVDTIFANITNPDLTIFWIQLFDADNDNIYNNSIVADQPGWYYVTIIANDTSGNVNNTEKTHFDPASLGGSGGGGGGGGGVAMQAYQNLPDWRKMPVAQIIKPRECIESWLCMPWTECNPEGYKTRICQDYYRCGTNKTIPITRIKCPKTGKTANKTMQKESEAEEPRYAVSLLLPPEETATTISSAGIISVVILIGISAYLILRKKKTKRNKSRNHQEEPNIANATESPKEAIIPDAIAASDETPPISKAAENKAKKKNTKRRKKTKPRKKKGTKH